MHGHHDRIVDNHYIVLKEENMSVSVIFKIAAVGILVTLLGQVLKHSGREEQATLLSVGGIIIVMLLIISELDTLFSTLSRIFGL